MTANSVPWLRSGVGSSPSDGGCIMQVIDWIHRNEWTDNPPCVHPVLRNLAIRANDSLGDEGRQRLLDLAPRLMGTSSDDKVLSVRLAVFCARFVLPIFENKYPDDLRPRKAIEAAEQWCDDPSADNRMKCRSAAANAATYSYDSSYAAAAAYAAADAGGRYANAAAQAADAAAQAAVSIMSLLTETLDEYDRLTERNHTETPDYTEVCAVMGR